MRVYVTKSVSVDSIRNDIDAKKGRQQGFERMPHDKKKRRPKNQQEAGQRENENDKSQTDRLQQTAISEQIVEENKGNLQQWG